MKSAAVLLGASLLATPALAVPVYLNKDNISVSLGAGTAVGGNFHNTANGYASVNDALIKVIDAPSASASENHTQATHIWWTAPTSGGGLELVFDFGVSYDITTLHFWNYAFDNYSVDEVVFTFFDSIDQQIGQQTLNPAPSGSEANITSQDYALVSPLNTRKVVALLSGTNREVDFQNIGFTAELSDPDKDPDAGAAVIPLPAGGLLLLSGLGGLMLSRRRALRSAGL